jgi:hypothetical protein
VTYSTFFMKKYISKFKIFITITIVLFVGLFIFFLRGHRDIPSARTFREIISTTSSTIPTEFNLSIPFISQAPEADWSEPWQNACEEATLAMLDAYYHDTDLDVENAKAKIVEMVEWESNAGWYTSIAGDSVVSLAREFVDLPAGFEFVVVEYPTVEMVKRSIASGHPVFALIDGKALGNPHFTNGGPLYHTLLIKGYTEDKFITNDPGTKYGEDFVYDEDHLMSVIHDWNGGDVPNGIPTVVMVRPVEL